MIETRSKEELVTGKIHGSLYQDAEVVAQVFRAAARGVHPAKIADTLNQECVPRPPGKTKRKADRAFITWDAARIRLMLRNPRYRSTLVEPAVWDQAQQIFPGRPDERYRSNPTPPPCGHDRHLYFCPDCRSYKAWRVHLRRRYDLTEDDYKAMLDAQAGVCPVCGKAENIILERGNIRRLSVDHDHLTMLLRGLLCGDCNQKLGWYEAHREAFERYLATVSERNPTGKKAHTRANSQHHRRPSTESDAMRVDVLKPIPRSSRKSPEKEPMLRPYGLRGNATEKAVVRGVFRAAMRGRTTTFIVDKLNGSEYPSPSGGVWTRATVRRILRDERYCQANGTNPLVDSDVWTAAQIVIRAYGQESADGSETRTEQGGERQ